MNNPRNTMNSNMNSAFMKSTTHSSYLNYRDSNPFTDDTYSGANQSLYGVPSIETSVKFNKIYQRTRSILLIDGNEHLQVANVDEFVHKLYNLKSDLKIKVVSIFGNTGDGKSHTLNQTFFSGEEVFQTCDEPKPCTMGVWAAFDPKLNVLCLDTEGLLGNTNQENVRTRLLLKVLAISDIVVFRTRAERLHRDMFSFLGSASRAYSDYFKSSLLSVSLRDVSKIIHVNTLGPSVIIFHETVNTMVLTGTSGESAEDVLHKRFSDMQLDIDAFSSMKYVGIRTVQKPTNFEPLRTAIIKELNNTTVRSARPARVVFNALKALNDQFAGRLANDDTKLFPDEYFTCQVKCLSCECSCQGSMIHLREGLPHSSETKCIYQHRFDNVAYVCKKCHKNGNEVVMTSRTVTQNDNSWFGIAKYAWSGYEYECPRCGEIYYSREHWFGNKNPEDLAVRTEITHVWTLDTDQSAASYNTAQRVVDTVSYLSETVTNISLQPTKAITSWMADQLAPSYWRPNAEVERCHKCKIEFSLTVTMHHCRACGEGFCHPCSSKVKPLPELNWHDPARVCDDCYEKENYSDVQADCTQVNLRKASEQVVSTLSAVGSVWNYSKALIKDKTRPSYWEPDSEVTGCCVCKKPFGPMLSLHHCRDCGRGVCDDCSTGRKIVLKRGLDHPVRVCDSCIKNE